MKIGIDIDGVLTDIEEWQFAYASKFYYQAYGKEMRQYKAYDTAEMFQQTKEKDTLFWKEYLEDYVTNYPARLFASEVLEKLKEQGDELYIITARVYGKEKTDRGEKMRKIVRDWLSQYHIPYNHLLFTEGDKKEICLREKIEVMIEDSPQNIESLSQEIPVICYHAEYNEQCIGNNIITCYSWYDIYAKIQEMKKKKAI